MSRPITIFACSFSRLFLVALVLQGCAAPGQHRDVARGEPLHHGSVLRFAELEEAKAIIGSSDDWVRAFGPFDRQLRMQSQSAVSEEQFLEFAGAQVRSWQPEDKAVVKQAIADIRAELGALDLSLPLPSEILLIKTSGKEEGDAGGYTRGSVIVVPEKQLQMPNPEFGNFLLHELFHVMTRHQPAIREPLYAIIGFQHSNEIAYPPQLLQRKITNPDAFHFDSYVELSVAAEPVLVMPLTLARTSEYSGGGVFDYVTVEFLEVEAGPAGVAPRYFDGEPMLYRMDDVAGYFGRIGRNTGYIIHPEEIMADNFWMAVRGAPDAPNPEILEAVLEVLR